MLQKLSRHAFVYLDYFTCNVGVINLKEYSIVIDIGSESSKIPRILEDLKAERFNPVRYIVFTHYHDDHISAGISGLENTTLILHEKTLNLIKDKTYLEPFNGRIESFHGEKILDDGEMRVHFITSEAHCPGAIMVYGPSDSFLFSGDNFVVDDCPFFCESSIAGSRAAYKLIRDLNPDMIIPGHGKINGVNDLDKLEGYLEDLIKYREGIYKNSEDFHRFWQTDYGNHHFKNMNWIKSS